MCDLRGELILISKHEMIILSKKLCSKSTQINAAGLNQVLAAITVHSQIEDELKNNDT